MKKKSYGSIHSSPKLYQYESFDKSIKDCPDKLHPPFHAVSRQGTVLAGIFNIVSTSLDGSVLTLPFLMYKSGILIGILLIVTIGILCAISLEFLAICTRKIQAVSYTELVYRLLGQTYRNIFSSLLFIILMFILVGFFMLMKGLAADIIQHYFQLTFNQYFLMFLLVIPIFP